MCAAKDIAACEDERDRLRLDRSGRGESRALHRLKKRGMKGEVIKLNQESISF